MEISTKSIKPSDFDVRDHLFDSPFQSGKKEVIARNIILLSKWNNDSWLSFTWQEYQKKCRHRVALFEKHILDDFVQDGYLNFEGKKYSVNDNFITTLKQFIKQ